MSPRVLEESVHPQLQSGASGRPLNFTVRRHGHFTVNGTVVGIFMAQRPGLTLAAVDEAVLEAGRGLVGDRYYLGCGTFSGSLRGKPDAEITLIEYEEIVRFNQSDGTDRSPGAFRRNLVTKGVRLNELVGRRFRVGAAELEGIRLCEPCGHLAKLVSPSVVKRMAHRAGLRARIVSGASIKKGDAVEVQDAV